MTLQLPTRVKDPEVQQALDVIARAFPVSDIAKGAVGTSDFAQTAKAPDADKLDGLDSTGFLRAVATLVGAGITVGNTSLTWSASTTAASKEITHGLGATPLIVIPVIVVGGSSRAFANAANYGATKFTLYGYAADGALNETLNVTWIAIG